MPKNNKIVKAVVGILKNTQGEILIAQRRGDQFMAGYWELPGGKIEAGESNEESLAREFREELDVDISSPNLMHTMCHQYPEKTVYLWIYTVDHFDGEARGAEGQNTVWCPIEKLNDFNLLPTMKAIIHKITLPEYYWITPSIHHQSVDWIAKFDNKLNKGIKLIQLRSKVSLDSNFIQKLYDKCKQYNTKLLLNTSNKSFNEVYCDGWHLTTAEMLALDARPCPVDKLLSASTHNLDEALKAQALEVDFIAISPVHATQTHPDSAPIGWEVAAEVVNKINIPVYLLGGMSAIDLEKSLKICAQGVAGVSYF